MLQNPRSGAVESILREDGILHASIVIGCSSRWLEPKTSSSAWEFNMDAWKLAAITHDSGVFAGSTEAARESSRTCADFTRTRAELVQLYAAVMHTCAASNTGHTRVSMVGPF